MPVLQPLSNSVDAPQQYKQPSRKGKKAWRKNVDVSEVQKGLEELKEEIIRGGVTAEKASTDLFALDTVGDAAIPKRFPKHVKKTLKADEIIAQRSAVPGVSLRKRPADKLPDSLVPAKRLRTNWVTHKEVAQLRKVADGQHETTITVTDATFDVWDAPEEHAEEDKQYTFLPPRQKKKAPKSLKQKPISLAVSGKEVPAIPKPKGGHSYNPVFSEYADRLAEESTKALKTEQKRIETEEAERLKKEAAARSAAEAEAAEARAELSEWDEDSAWEGFESGVEDDAVSAKRQQRKTQAQRNKIKRRKEEERTAKHDAALKRKNAQADRIKQVAREVAEREQALAVARMELSDSGSEADDEVLRRKQLGKYKLPEKDLELVLPDELQESLRLLKPEGDLLKDRYRSFLVRGKVESRRHIPFKKQQRSKITEKWTYKDFTI